MNRRTLTLAVSALFLAVALGWIWLRCVANGFSARAQPSLIEAWTARSARKLAVPRNAKALRNPVPYSDAVLEEARAHWADHCSFCHANDGSGNSEVGRNLYPKAPDMRGPTTQSFSDGELYYAIKNGIRLTGMPAWGEPGGQDEDSWKLVYFIRHLPKMTPQEAERMIQLNPKSPTEIMENKEEEQFLEGNSGDPKTTPHKGMHSQRKGAAR